MYCTSFLGSACFPPRIKLLLYPSRGRARTAAVHRHTPMRLDSPASHPPPTCLDSPPSSALHPPPMRLDSPPSPYPPPTCLDSPPSRAFHPPPTCPDLPPSSALYPPPMRLDLPPSRAPTDTTLYGTYSTPLDTYAEPPGLCSGTDALGAEQVEAAAGSNNAAQAYVGLNPGSSGPQGFQTPQNSGYQAHPLTSFYATVQSQGGTKTHAHAPHTTVGSKQFLQAPSGSTFAYASAFNTETNNGWPQGSHFTETTSCFPGMPLWHPFTENSLYSTETASQYNATENYKVDDTVPETPDAHHPNYYSQKTES